MFTIVERIEPLQIMTLDEAKDHLVIVDFNDDDEYILSLIKTAGQMAERHTKALYNECLVQAQMDERNYCGYLPLSPVISVISAINDGNEIDYKFNVFSNQITLTASQLNPCETTVVSYRAGHIVVPDIVKHACKIIVGDLYQNRESDADAKMSTVTFNALRLLK